MNIKEGAVHLAGIVFEDAKFDYFSRQGLSVFRRVAFLNAQQDEDAIRDGGVFTTGNHNACLGYAFTASSRLADV